MKKYLAVDHGVFKDNYHFFDSIKEAKESDFLYDHLYELKEIKEEDKYENS